MTTYRGPLLEMYERSHRPTIFDKINATTCIEELRGMWGQVFRGGRMTPEISIAFDQRAKKLKG